MLKFSFYSLVIAGAISLAAISRLVELPGSIKGVLQDKDTREAIPFVSVLIEKDSAHTLVKVGTATTDMDGQFTVSGLVPGKYHVRAMYVGYAPQLLKDIGVVSGKTTHVTVALKATETKLSEVEIITYTPPTTIDADTKTGTTVHREDYQVLHFKEAHALMSPSTIGYASNHHSKLTLRGGRGNPADYNTEEYSLLTDNPFKDASKDPLSTFSIDVDKASYSNVRRFLMQGQMPPADAVRVEELVNYFPYNYPQPADNVPFSIRTQYLECPWNKAHNLIHIGIQGKKIKTEHLPANNLVFLVDVSGSMEDANKLPSLKSGLRLLIDQMRPEDKVSMAVYAGAAGVVLPPTSGKHKEQMIEALESLSAGGSTAGGEGIELAYKLAKQNFISNGNNRVILATDGDFNVGVSSEGDLVRLIESQKQSGVFLTVLGFGTGNYKDSKMEQLADKGNGNYAYIDNILEAKKVLVKEMGGTLLTIAKDVKIQIEFNPAKVKGYRLVGYENRLLNKEDFNDDKKDAGDLGSGHNVTAIYEIIPAGSSELVASVDSLVYQQVKPIHPSKNNEVMTIKFRYKDPAEQSSKLITEVLLDHKTSFSSASEDCRFALSVAAFGMVLRGSAFKGDADYKSILTVAKSAKGKDEDGYRAEFIRLVEMAELIKK